MKLDKNMLMMLAVAAAGYYYFKKKGQAIVAPPSLPSSVTAPQVQQEMFAGRRWR